MKITELHFDLPDAQIATTPAEPRDAARLMVCNRQTGDVQHVHIRDLPTLGILKPGDLMVKNHTRVLRARLEGTRAATGGRIRGLLLHHDARTWTVLLESGGRLQPHEHIDLGHGSTLLLHQRDADARWTATLEGDADTLSVLARCGKTPLPPYILAQRRRGNLPDERPEDFDRYNTTFHTDPGFHADPRSVAAPTAGLHLTAELLNTLTQQGVQHAGVTLDIGPGTFAPVRTDTLEDHDIHGETLHIPAVTTAALQATHAAGGRVLAVGTTTVRAIESLPPDHANDANFTTHTHLFITPDRVANGDFTWQHTDLLLTNFHLPQSTLLALVAALPGVGIKQLLAWYRIAVNEGYHFYSFGDAMLVV
ncbi:MAG: tRNA preQ1(34) S-adenosylmethionine ribosyltransferase-isomerase QueA [Algisphaera sp.]